MFTAQTEWDCPEHFPDLSDAKYIAIDLETKDPDLKIKRIRCHTRTWRNSWCCRSCRWLVWLLSYCT